MKKINRYLSIITIAIATPLIMPLYAMKEQEEQKKEDSSIVIKNPVKTAFLLASQDSDNITNRSFIIENLNTIDIETLEKSLEIFTSKGKKETNLYKAIQNKIIEKKRFLEKNKRKRNDKDSKGKDIKKKKTNNEQKTDCPICQKNVHKGTLDPVELPCKHIIHTTCFFTFFKKALADNRVEYSCPFCKKTIDLKVLLSLLDKKIFIPHTSRLDYQNHITKNIIKKQLNDGSSAGANNLIQSMALFSDDEIKTLFTNAIRREEDSKIVKILLNNKDIAPKLDFFGAFSEAVTFENITIIQELLKTHNFIKKTFPAKEMNSLFLDAAQKNNENIVKIFLTNNDINSSIVLDYFTGFYTAAIHGNIESLKEFLEPTICTKSTLYTNAIQPIVNYLKNKAESGNIQETEIDSIQNYVSEVFPQDSKLNGYKEHLCYLFFVILIASGENFNHAKIIENTLKKDSFILTTIATAQGNYWPYENKKTIESILFGAINLNDEDILNLLLTSETLNALDNAPEVINDLFKKACENRAYASLEALFNNEIFNDEVTSNTIHDILSYAIEKNETEVLDIILNQETLMATRISDIDNKYINYAIEQESYDALTTIITHKNPTLARKFFESKAWEEEFMTALKDDNEDLIDALLEIDKSILTESKFMDILVLNKDVITKQGDKCDKINIFKPILHYAIKNKFNSLFYICLYHGILSKEELQDAVDSINLEIEEKENLKKEIQNITIIKQESPKI